MSDHDKKRQADEDFEDVSEDQEVEEAQEGLATLMKAPKGAVSKWVRSRWRKQDSVWKKRAVQLRVNYLRYSGHTFAQAHPNDETRIYEASIKKKTYPTMNKILRGVQRYVAQVTADEPTMEAIPKDSSDRARDAAEAASSAIEGEWVRANLNGLLRRIVHISAILRSSFLHMEWDPFDGGHVPARKFFENPETGEQELQFVDGSGFPVDDQSEAAQILEGNIRYEALTPGNVRFWGGRYAHEADEVMVGKLVPLRKVYSTWPKLRERPLEDLVGAKTPESEQWLEDIRGESPNLVLGDDDGEIDDVTGADISDSSAKLDERVFVVKYYKKRDRQYKKGFQATVVGKVCVQRGALKYGIIPVAQFKCLDELADQLGRSVVDILRDPQELMDFINGQILRYLQMMRRRWFVPTTSMVKASDLKNPTQSIIKFNPAGGNPIPEQQPDIPNSIVDWSDRFDRQFDDALGIHETMQGKHVPGVSSGRHAEALRTGDETILGLTRTQIEEGLVHTGRVILEIIKEEWSTERQVHYFGEGREYVHEAFKGTQFGETDTVRLKRGTMLMLTPAQKLETIFSFAQLGVLDANDLRRLSPLVDTAGISMTEDPHYKRARRENRRFLAGPPEDLVGAFERFEGQVEGIERTQELLQHRMQMGLVDEQAVQETSQTLMENLENAEEEFAQVRDQYAWPSEEWEFDPRVAIVHATEHARALAHDRADALPEFWRAMFMEHLQQHQQAAGILPQPEAEGGGEGAGQDVRHTSELPPASPEGFSAQGFPTSIGQAN